MLSKLLNLSQSLPEQLPILKSVNPWGNRKLYLTIFTMLCGLVMVFFDKIKGLEWLEFAKWILAIYVGGNVGEKAVIKPNTAKQLKMASPDAVSCEGNAVVINPS